MLYPPDIKLLKTLKKAQSVPNYYVAINTHTMQAYTTTGYYTDDVDTAFKGTDGVPIKLSEADLEVSLQYLLKHEFITKPSSGSVYQVTRSGWYNRYVRRREILSLILTHVLFPSVVAFITTIITLIISTH